MGYRNLNRLEKQQLFIISDRTVLTGNRYRERETERARCGFLLREMFIWIKALVYDQRLPCRRIEKPTLLRLYGLSVCNCAMDVDYHAGKGKKYF